MNYRFGAARQLYQQARHPRLYLSAADVGRLRQAVRRGTSQRIMATLRRRVRPIVAATLATTELPQVLAKWNTTWHEPGTRLVFGLHDLALHAVLDQDPDATEVVRRVLAACPEAEAVGRHEECRRLGYAAGDVMAKVYDLAWPLLTPAERRAFCQWGYQSGVREVLDRFQVYLKHPGGNMAIGGMESALLMALAIAGDEGVPDLAADLARLVPMFAASCHVGLNPDGYPEEDIGYGTAIGASFVQVGEVLRRAGLYDPYRECPRYARFGHAILHFVQPWGEDLSNTGDHGDDFGNREFALGRLAVETQEPALAWLLGTLSYNHGRIHPENDQPEFYREAVLRPGVQVPATAETLFIAPVLKTAVPPSRRRLPTAFRDRVRGIVSFRSGWDADDTFVVFDGSQRSAAAQGHAHASCGHFSLSALGEYFAIDTGRYNAEQNCHNVVLVGGQSGRSTDGEWIAVKHPGRLTGYQPGKVLDFASVDSSHQHNCYWAYRHLGLVKGPGAPGYVFTIEDINQADDWGTYWWQLHTSPENTIVTAADHATITGWRHGNRLDVHFMLLAPDEYPRPHELTAVEQDVAVPSSCRYIPDPVGNAKGFYRPAAMVHGPVYTRPRLLAKVAGYNGRFMAVMVPYRQDEPAPVVARLPSLPASFGVKVTWAAVEDVIIFAYEHQLLEAGDVRGCGRCCVVRRDRRNGRVLASALLDGTALRVGKLDLSRRLGSPSN